MYASKVKLRKFRSFENVEVKLGKYLTCISGQNGVGKSQILALIGNSGQIPKRIGETLQGFQFRADWSEIVKGDPDHDELSSVRHAVAIQYKELPDSQNLDKNLYPDLGLVDSLEFRTFWQNSKIPFKRAIAWKRSHKSQKARDHIDDLARRSVKRAVAQMTFSDTDTDSLKFIDHINQLILEKGSLEQLFSLFNKNSKLGRRLMDNITVSVPQRLRIIPEKKGSTRRKEAKLPWPTYYLGLSRLYPPGEADSPEVRSIELSPEDNKYIQEEYNKIFSTNEDKFELSSIHLSESPRKHGIGVENKTFGPLGNSNGQDNLNQILAAMLSFKKLNKKLGANFFGGVLLIDELDASLHPAAQNKLLDFMAEQTRHYNYQIIFTTHSLSMIEHFSHLRQGSKTRDDVDFMLTYLTNGRGVVESKENPALAWIHNELLISYNNFGTPAPRIPIITEDDVATDFLKEVLNKWYPEIRVDFLNLATGWENLLNLIGQDFNYFGKWITVLDADVPIVKAQKKLNQSMFRIQKITDSNEIGVQDVLLLPNLLPDKNTDKISILEPELAEKDLRPYIELELWLFLKSLDDSDPFYANPQIDSLAYFKRTLIADGPFSEKYKKGKAEDKVKAWYKDNQQIINIAWSYFIDQKKEIIKPFVKRFILKYNSIAAKYYSNLEPVKVK